MAILPDLSRARVWVNIPADLLPDVDLQQMLDAAVEAVGKACRVPVDGSGTVDKSSPFWPDNLCLAVLRRVQKSVAVKSLPLGVLDQAGEYGPAKIPAYDAQIEAYEGPFRKLVFGAPSS